MIYELHRNRAVIFKGEYLYSLLLLLVMERMTFGLDFRDLEGLEVLEEVEFQAVGAAHAKAPRPNTALCCRPQHTLNARLSSCILSQGMKDGGCQTGTVTKQQTGENRGGMG